MNGAQSLVNALEAAGVDVMFGIPGGAILPAYDPIFDSKIRHILVRHEQGAGHAATGYAQVTGRVGVCIATSGPGATNLVTPLADAQMDSVPVVAITGQVPSAAIGTDAFQETDIGGICLPITKKCFLLDDISKAEDMFRTIKSPSADIYAVAKEAVEMGGKTITYKALQPYAAAAVALYKAGTVPAEEARQVHDLLNEIADDNTIRQEELAEQYLAEENAKKEKRARQISKLYTKYKIRMNKEFKKVESEIFDCEYFKGIYMSDYEEGKDDVSIVKTVYSRLKKRKCSDEDPFIMELKEQYKVLAAAENEKSQLFFNVTKLF